MSELNQPLNQVMQLPANALSGTQSNISFPLALSLFRKLKKDVFLKRPMLRDILQKYGSNSLYEFTKSHIQSSNYSQNQDRKEQFITVLTQNVQELLGSTVAESVARQIRKYPCVITADHHGALGHPGFAISNLLESMSYADSKDPDLENVIVLSCANVSFDNYSFPRGLRFHSFSNKKITESQITFFGRTVDARPVVNFRPYTYETIQSIKTHLWDEEKEGNIQQITRKKLEHLVDEVFASSSVLSRHNFSDQASIVNASLWKKFFGNTSRGIPNLVYLEQEEIINQLIILYHLYQNTSINQILFNKHYHKSILRNFDNIMGAFSSQDNSGTFLFWSLPKGHKYRVQLKKQGRFLSSPDQSYLVELTPNAIHNAILNKEIFPSTLLSFMVLSFYHGIRLVGGFNQTTYLTQMKQGYISMQNELGDTQSAKDLMDMPTTDMVFTRPIAYLQESPEMRIPATGLDIILHGNDQTVPLLQQTAKQITLREAVYAKLIPYLYRTYYPKEEQDVNLLAITEEDIEKSIGLDKKYYFLPND